MPGRPQRKASEPVPYSALPPSAFWKPCQQDPDFHAQDIYAPKVTLRPEDRIATAGSCFARNITRYLTRSNLTFHQAEPSPRGMDTATAQAFGYDLYSARYGNIYTARQLRQLIEDALALRVDDAAIWLRGMRHVDALRPTVEPEGLASVDEVRAHRLDHLRHVASMLRDMDVLIFTLGLSETWEDVATGRVFPSAPGVVAGTFDPACHRFVNQTYPEVLQDMQASCALLRKVNPGVRLILTVSPVPLSATASGAHVLAATTYSKSVLRAVAGDLAAQDDGIDYFPSYELITGQPFAGTSFDANRRTVAEAAIDRVMSVFFAAHGATLVTAPAPGKARRRAADPTCEEAMLDGFAPR
ncbi:MAG: hypothetical protein CML02_04060 [Pseudooceanicola sp.]|jgi:hypothetical protein|nr:hypothetical protein [Pseudooceanicola sp.]